MEKDRWWDAWPTAVTTDDEIEDIVTECGHDIAMELLAHLRDTRRDEVGEKSIESKDTAA